MGTLFFASSAAWAKPHGGACGGRGAHKLEKLERDVAKLGLEQAQLDAAYQVIDEARKERRGLDAQIRAAHDRMRELLDQDAPDVDTVTAQADTIGALMTQARKIELRAAVQVRSMLTPEQRKQLAEKHDRFAKRGERGQEL
jgi:Spy/CpxP family protein refolding chaperone